MNIPVANKNTPPSAGPGGVKPGVSYADAVKKGTGKAEVSEKTYAEALKATGTDGAASWRVDAVARQKVPNGRMNTGPGSTAFVMKKGGGDSGSNAGRDLFSGRSTSTASGSGSRASTSGSSRAGGSSSNASHRAPSQLSERPVGKREAISRDGRDSAKNANAYESIDNKMRTLESAQRNAVRVRELPDGRIRYYREEKPSYKKGLTRGAVYVTEYTPKTGQVRSWYECYDHQGKVNRVHPKTLDGQDLKAQHYPATKAEILSWMGGEK